MRSLVLCEPAQSKCTRTFHKSYFVLKCSEKMPDANLGATVLWEPAQSKCTWTFPKSHFVRKFKRKMPDASDTTSIKHRALTLTVRTPQCGHTVWGIYIYIYIRIYTYIIIYLFIVYIYTCINICNMI